MDGERKVHICEGVPLNSTGSANIFVNAGKHTTKLNTSDGTVIHLNTEKPADLDVHINTMFSLASSKKIKLLFIINFSFSLLCMILSGSMGFYYWNEMSFMRKQLDQFAKDQYFMRPDQVQLGTVAALERSPPTGDARHPRIEGGRGEHYNTNTINDIPQDVEHDMLAAESRTNTRKENLPVHDSSLYTKDQLVVQFNGGTREVHLGAEIVGPWVRDTTISTPNSQSRIDVLDAKKNLITIKEGGLYLVYAQLVYLSNEPSCYYVWATVTGRSPRLLSMCGTGDVSARRPFDRSHVSCGVQTLARLYDGDTVNVAQREPNRTVVLKEGASYIGFVKLSS